MTPAKSKARPAPGPVQRLASLLVLAALAVTAGGVYWVSQGLNPAVKVYLGQKAAGQAGPDLAAFAPADLIPQGKTGIYTAKDLHIKINGKADLYLRAGFKRLITRRFSLKQDPGLWAEVYLYEMTSAQAAQGVLGAQRRSDAQDLDLGAKAYASKNAVFLASGPHYAELVGSAPEAKLLTALKAWAKSFASQAKPENTAKTGLSEERFFPTENLVPGSITRAVGAALGFAGYAGVYTARYKAGKGQVVAYISLRKSPEEAKALAASYMSFIKGNGGTAQAPPQGLAGAQAAELFGQKELVMVHGRALYGVSAAGQDAALLSLAQALQKRIAEKLP